MISHENWLAACIPFTPTSPPSSISPLPAIPTSPSTPALPLLPLQYSTEVPFSLIAEPKSEFQWLSYGGTSDPGVEDRTIFAQEAIWRVRSWAVAERARRSGRDLPFRRVAECGDEGELDGGEERGDGVEGKVWVRPGCDGLKMQISASATELGEFDVVDDVYS